MARLRQTLAATASGFVITWALAPVTGLAQSADGTGGAGVVSLEPVVVTGARGDGSGSPSTTSDQSGVPAPRQATVLTKRVIRADLDAAQIQDVDDIGRVDPGVSFNEATRSFNVRGLDDNRVLTTIDGIRVPFIEDGARGLSGGVSAFDFDTLSTLDIVKGADSSIFGAGALGGVVALRTLNPEDLLVGGKVFGGLSRLSFDSKDDSWGVDQALAARLRDTYMFVQGGYRTGNETETQGMVGGFGSDRTQANPLDYDQKNILAKIRQHVGEGQVYGLTGEIYDRSDDIDTMTSAPSTYRPGSAFTDEVQRRERISASYELTPDAGAWLDGADAVVYWQRQELSSDFRGVRVATPLGDYSRRTDRDETTFGANGSALKSFDLGSTVHNVSVGGEIGGNRSSQFSSGQDSCPPGPYSFRYFYGCSFLHTNQADMPKVDGLTMGLFIQDEIVFSDRLRLTPGVRFDYYEQNPQDTPGFLDNPTVTALPGSSSDNAVSPKLRAEWDAFEGVTVYGQYASGFRAPTASELYLSYGGPGTYLRLGNAELESETSDGFEAGLRLGDDRLGGTVSGFYNRYRNFIDTVSVDPAAVGVGRGAYPLGISRYINRESVEIYGVEATARWQITESWHSTASFASYVGRDRETDEYLNSIPAMKGIFNVGYGTGVWGADLYLTAAAARDDVENDLSKTPSYGLVDVTGWWKPTQMEGMKLTAGLYNVFDKTYYDALDIPDSATQPKEFYSETGRSLKATLTYQF